MEFVSSALPWLLCVAGFSFLSWELCRAREMSRAEISRATMKTRVAIVRDEYERLAKEAAFMREKLARYEAQRQTRPGVVAMPARDRLFISGLDVTERHWAPTETAEFGALQ